MAAVQQLRIASAVSAFLPRLSSTTLSASFRSQQSALPSWTSLAIAIPAAVQTIPGLLGDIWEGILRAVPKSKTSHMKKRHRLLAGKALKDVTALGKCPACGHTKKMHTLCPHCMGSTSPPNSRPVTTISAAVTDNRTEIQGMFPNTSKPDDAGSATAA